MQTFFPPLNYPDDKVFFRRLNDTSAARLPREFPKARHFASFPFGKFAFIGIPKYSQAEIASSSLFAVSRLFPQFHNLRDTEWSSPDSLL